MRRQAIQAVRHGQRVTNLATDSGVHVQSVLRRRSSFSNDKAAVLQAKLTSGRVSNASQNELRWTASAPTWTPVCDAPAISMTRGRFSLNMLAAVSPRGDVRFMLPEGSGDAVALNRSHKRLMPGVDRPVFVEVDEHAIDKTKLLNGHAASIFGALTLSYLPPYSTSNLRLCLAE